MQAWNGESGNELCRCCWLVLNFLKLVKNLSYAWLMNDMFNICNKWHIFDLPPIYYIDPKYDMFTYVNSLQFITTRKLTISEGVSPLSIRPSIIREGRESKQRCRKKNSFWPWDSVCFIKTTLRLYLNLEISVLKNPVLSFLTFAEFSTSCL